MQVATTKSGGQALNLTEASRSIICDPWWNAAADEQAEGRIHRMGQEKLTHSIRLLARDTIDDDITKKHQEKSEEINETLQDDGHESNIKSEWQAMKIAQPERWLAWVRRCMAEVRGEGQKTIHPDLPLAQMHEAQAAANETEPTVQEKEQDEEMEGLKTKPDHMVEGQNHGRESGLVEVHLDTWLWETKSDGEMSITGEDVDVSMKDTKLEEEAPTAPSAEAKYFGTETDNGENELFHPLPPTVKGLENIDQTD